MFGLLTVSQTVLGGSLLKKGSVTSHFLKVQDVDGSVGLSEETKTQTPPLASWCFGLLLLVLVKGAANVVS